MQQPSDLSGTDDEAPEEVALSVGKSQATVRRDQERLQAEHAQHFNSRHKRKRGSESEALSEAAPERSEHKAALDQDALPDEVIEALTSTHGAAVQAPSTADLPQQPATRLKYKRQQMMQKQLGPITVRVLDSGLSGQPSESAVQFVEQQLHVNKRRSLQMLRPCRNWSGKHSNTIRNCSGPAMQFVKSTS
ncbi:hypothetical protein WJX77_000926 [Trebouxia sp. C0004]